MRKQLAIGASLLLIASLGGCHKPKQSQAGTTAPTTAPASAAAKTDLVATLGGSGDLSTITQLIGTAGLQKALAGKASYTIFAPTDSAFASMPGDQRALLGNAQGRPQLIALLRQHIAPGYIMPADIDRGLARKGGGNQLATVGAAPISLHKDGSNLLLGNGAYAPRVIGDPLLATNGVVYRIDRVLPPLSSR